MARLTLERVTKRFEAAARPAVDDLSLTVEDGEFVVLVGPSGSGKTTALRLVAGLEEPDRGSIRLDYTGIDHEAPKDRDVVMVFQDYALYPSMTVRENMGFGLAQSTDMPKSEIAERVRTAAEMLDIVDLVDRMPDQLSGGQQQRVALGRAIVRDPEVFLMDEPLSNLDARLSDRMRTEIKQIQRELGITTLYVTHDQTEAMTMGDRIAVLRDGRLQQVGTPIECYDEPANRFVAGFLGEPSMNFIECDRREDRLVAGEFAYPLSRELRATVGDAERVALGVRPEDVEFRREPEGPRDLVTTVSTVEPTGSEQTVHLEPDGSVGVEGGHGECRSTFVVTVPGTRRVETGRAVVVRVPESAVYLFDGESGETLRAPPRTGNERVRT
ncbi:MAG: ABC transporter ATP-binding protein [Haloferacaceae archaeon]